ncbi:MULTISPECIES: glycosyltransferase family 2 protein [Vitreoscilla]|uniref:Glycosyltransferase family 2 protein n=1 Tax=Vitreoscilla stercoraria TaxID=61 RepID=A0ABY4EEW2_VITST|nr:MULTISPECIES: glycosyltransferase family 2 protein [Vitreoscilla]AUZ05173.2 hypothetical protein ADP71_16170 [Vitreoscilla sp. C1]UOO93480.1 glycosyltransferase family 2 protein [Vitreoscilla stercoraria]
MSRISVLILAKNEAHNIRECIDSCSFADEVIIIDDSSTDDTRAIAESLGARVIERNMNGDWGGQQTFAISQASHEWIFFIDADERCTPSLCTEIRQVVQSGEQYGYWIKRINHFQHKLVQYGPLSPDWVCRLMPTKGSYVEGFVHPKIVHQHTDKKLSQTMLHYTYETWEQYLRKMNQYSTLAAEKNYQEGKRCNVLLDVVLRPAFAFFKMYVLKKGFLDGAIGYMLSKNYANYTMNKYVKLKYLQDQASQNR